MKQFIISLILFLNLFSQSKSRDSTIGFGVGTVASGVLWFSLEAENLKNTYFILGWGKSENDFSFKVGLRYYFNPLNDHFRFRVSTHFGPSIRAYSPVRFGYINYGGTPSQLYSFFAGIGFTWFWGESKKFGMDMNLNFPFYFSKSIEALESRSVSKGDIFFFPRIGLRYRF